MRQFSQLALLLMLVLSIAPPAGARIAMIQTMAPLQDHAEQSIQAAFREALETAVKGAVAMGLSWVKLGRALVLENMVVVQNFATDTRLAERMSRRQAGGRRRARATCGAVSVRNAVPVMQPATVFDWPTHQAYARAGLQSSSP